MSVLLVPSEQNERLAAHVEPPRCGRAGRRAVRCARLRQPVSPYSGSRSRAHTRAAPGRDLPVPARRKGSRRTCQQLEALGHAGTRTPSERYWEGAQVYRESVDGQAGEGTRRIDRSLLTVESLSGRSLGREAVALCAVPGLLQRLPTCLCRGVPRVLGDGFSVHAVAQIGVDPTALRETLQADRGCGGSSVSELDLSSCKPTGRLVLFRGALRSRSGRHPPDLGLRWLRTPAWQDQLPRRRCSTLSAASTGASRTSSSHSLTTCQPVACSSAVTSRSRSIVRRIFDTQNSLLLGNRSSRLSRPRLTWALPCQKSPSTKTATPRFRTTMSGQPRTSLACRR